MKRSRFMKRWNERNGNPEQVLVDIPEIVDRMRERCRQNDRVRTG
jgi:hypothetical protein